MPLPVRFSHGPFCFVFETHHGTGRNVSFRPEPIERQPFLYAEQPRDFIHRLNVRSRSIISAIIAHYLFVDKRLVTTHIIGDSLWLHPCQRSRTDGLWPEFDPSTPGCRIRTFRFEDGATHKPACICYILYPGNRAFAIRHSRYLHSSCH